MSLFALLSLTLTTGCSTLRLGYSQADTLAYWWLDQYLDFTPAQAPAARQALSQWQAWHRSRQAAEDAGLLEQAAQEALADATPAQSCRWWKLLQDKQELHMQTLGPLLLQALGEISDAQIKAVQAGLDKSNRDWRQDYLRGDADQRHRASWERIVDRADSLYGTVDSAQRRFISERLRASPWDPMRWMAERQRQQRDMVDTLRAIQQAGADKEQRHVLLRGWVSRTVQPLDEPARLYRDQLIRFQCELAADLHNRTSPAQRRYAADKLKGWAKDVREVAGVSLSTNPAPTAPSPAPASATATTP